MKCIYISLLILISGILISCFDIVGFGVEPELLTQPISATIQNGREASFFVQVSGDPLPVISWERSSDGNLWEKIEQATGSKYTFVVQTADNGALFRVKVGKIISEIAVLTVVNNGVVSQINQYGITWTFDKPYQTGSFANGDYWIVGPINIIYIDPVSKNISGRVKNGSMLNPSPALGINQGYDNTCVAVNYSSSHNVAFNVSPSNSLTISTGSLISTISNEEAWLDTQIKTAAILTVLSSAPASGSFRPPYCGTTKSINYNVSQLTSAKYNLLGRLTPVTTIPALSTVERFFERPWIDHMTTWSGRVIHPELNMPRYGRDISTNVGIGSLMLHTNFTDTEKETLLIRYLQLGIDLYGIAQNGGRWYADGGHFSGRKWPILFAGIMLDDSNMRGIGAKSGDYVYTSGFGPGNLPPDYIGFGEDDQTFYVTSEDVIRTNSTSWSPDTRGGTPIPYTSGDVGLAEWGIRHATDPFRDNALWYVYYRNVTGICWAGFVLSARIMESNASAMMLWNHDALFDYMDRYMAVTAENSLIPAWRYSVIDMNDIWATHPGGRQTSSFVADMWDTYRSSF